jgi:hypothetical protein
MACQDPAKCGTGIKKGQQAKFTFVYPTGVASTTAQWQAYKSDASKAGIAINLVGQAFNAIIGEAATCAPMSPKCNVQVFAYGGWGFDGCRNQSRQEQDPAAAPPASRGRDAGGMRAVWSACGPPPARAAAHPAAEPVMSLSGTQPRPAAEASIASQTACTAAPCAKPGDQAASGQPSSRSAAWLANDEP